MEKVETKSAPKALGPYSQAIKAGDFLFVSGQLPMIAATGQLMQGSIEEMTEQVLKNLEAIVLAAGGELKHAVRCEVFLTDLKDFQKVNAVYAAWFPGDHPPARQTIQVAALPMGSPIEISCIVFLGENELT